MDSRTVGAHGRPPLRRTAMLIRFLASLIGFNNVYKPIIGWQNRTRLGNGIKLAGKSNPCAKKQIFLFTFFLMTSCVFALAQEGLYGDPPPPNAAFVRVIQTVEFGTTTDIFIGETNFGVLGFAEVSPYRVILSDTYSLTTEEINQTIEIEAGKFYSLALRADDALLIEDTSNTNRAKALLNLYNLSELSHVDMTTADGQIEVLMDVSPMDFKSIEVNGITVDLAVLANGESLAVFEKLALERAAAYSAIVFGNELEDAERHIIWVQSEILID